MNVFILTIIYTWPGLLLALYVGLLSQNSFRFGLAVSMLAYFAGALLLLRCPRCKALTWTRRWAKGQRGFFNQRAAFLPPRCCSLCNLNYTRSYFWKKYR